MPSADATAVSDSGASPGSAARARLAEFFRTVMAIAPDGAAIHFAGKDYSRGQFLAAASDLDALLDRAGVPAGAPVGWIARNEPALVTSALGILIGRRCVSLVNPHASATAVAAAVEKVRPPAVVASPRDWSGELRAATARIGAVGIAVDLDEEPTAQLVEGLEAPCGSGFHEVGDDVAVELLTSGTTGEPKRIPLKAEKLLDGLALGIRKDRRGEAADDEELTVKRSPGIVQTPMSHVGGLFRALLCVRELRPLVLRERFTVDEFVEDLVKWRPKAVGMVPAMVAMVLDADVPREAFSSVLMVRSATSALPVERKRAFQEKYGVPVVSEYGASEFFGGITQWTLADHQQFGEAKIASVGRPKRDVTLRILSQETGAELPAGEIGLLSLKGSRFGPDWIATTDLASIDADGFVFIHGRADQAIVRGGFKVLPDKVAEVFRLREDVREACVVGVSDRQLGQVPVAVIECAPDRPRPTPDILLDHAREHLARYQVPIAVEVVDRLPRTATMKIALGEVQAAMEQRYARK